MIDGDSEIVRYGRGREGERNKRGIIRGIIEWIIEG